MGLSIQDYLKKINSWLTFTDIVSIFMILLASSVFLGYILHKEQKSKTEVIYKESVTEEKYQSSQGVGQEIDAGKPFGSRKGKTYTFSWCSGSGNIKPANKIYFASPSDAEAKGRTLSKLCKK
jgi:hypothetical protein